MFVAGNSRLVLERCLVEFSVAEFNGGAVAATLFGSVTAVDCVFHQNVATIGVGGALAGDQRTSFNISGCDFGNNVAEVGGAASFAGLATGVIRGTLCASGSV